MTLGQRDDRGPVRLVVRLQELDGPDKDRNTQSGEGQHRHQHLTPAQPAMSSLGCRIRALRHRVVTASRELFCHIQMPIAHILIMATPPMGSL